MKKTLIAVTAVLLLVTTSAFADITMGACIAAGNHFCIRRYHNGRLVAHGFCARRV